MVVLMLSHSSGVPGVCFAAIWIAVLVSIVFKIQGQRERMARNCGLLATRLGGRYRPGGMFQSDVVQFEIDGRSAVLEFHEGKVPYTNLHVVLPRDPGGRLKISRDSVAQIFITVMDGRRFLVGDRFFDSMYAVRAYPASLAERVFATSRRQEAMTAVRRLICCTGLTIEVTPSFFKIRIREMADAPEVAMALVRTAKDFLRFLYEVEPVPGIKWGTFVESLSGHCPICSTTLVEPLVRCPRCLQPHHRECWQYVGRCSTYGCDPGSRRRSA